MRIQTKALTTEGALFVVEGELDAYTGPQLREDLARASGEGARWLFIQLSEVSYIDSVGLGILVGAAKRVLAEGGGLAVVAPRPNVLRVFEISGTRELLNVAADLAAAAVRLGCPSELLKGVDGHGA